MSDVTPLISRKVPRKSMLFHFLREKAIEDLQKRAALTWTDHNVHDPGITVTEALCYVITELSNQLNFPFADLIATPDGIAKAPTNYPSAAVGLPCHPVSINDFRKVILDLPGIRNAYFEISNESKVPVFYDPVAQLLTYDAGPTVLPIEWGGLYAIQLEFDDDELNANLLTDTIQVHDGTSLRNVDIIISFKYWDELSAEFFRSNTITTITLEDTIVTLSDLEYDDYYSEWKIDFSDGSSVNDFPVWVKLVLPLAVGDPIIPNIPPVLEAALKATLATSPFVRYKQRMMDVKTMTDDVHRIFHLNRNLGEDLSLFLAMRIQEIALHASVEIQLAADPVEIYAQILFQIESFFTPRPGFQSLKVLLADSDFKVDEVFLGPLLASGFLSDEKLNMLSRGDVIYVSDLVHIILDIENTAAIRDVSLSTFFNNFEAITNERNCVRIRGGDRYKPRLTIERSHLELTRNGIPVIVDQALVNARLVVLRAESSMLPDNTVNDLDIPIGIPRDYERYRSVQYELPATYGTGDAGIALSSTQERMAQLKQLQGYLFFFDQLLANTFSQLENVGDLFSVHQQNQRTYHFQSLYHLPGAEDLLGHLGGSAPWSDFISSTDNPYLEMLREAGESDDEFFQRRNAVLDYLLARTAEERYTYSAILSSMPASALPEIILREKELFLANYPLLSRDRSQAYNYLKLSDAWDSLNVGGFERMVCHKLGFLTSMKRNLYHPLTDNFTFFTVNIPPVRTRFRLIDNIANNLMVCRNHFADNAEATGALGIFLEVGRYRDYYEIFRLSNSNFSFKLVHGPLDLLYDGATSLLTQQDAEDKIKLVIDIIGDRYSLEGIHVVEHILLRPKIRGSTVASSDKLFAWLTAEETVLNDPYSHVVSVVLPSGKEKDFALNTDPLPSVPGYRMQNEEYAQFANQTVLREAPAHLMVNVFFLHIDTDPGEAAVHDRSSLQNFERKFRAWRETRADPTATEAAKLLAQQQLVTVIEKMYGV